jgi:hypothetical protein
MIDINKIRATFLQRPIKDLDKEIPGVRTKQVRQEIHCTCCVQ